jgi:hypothetical protein
MVSSACNRGNVGLSGRHAQSLDHAADRLAVQRQRVVDSADILDDETVEQFDIAGSRVDRDVEANRPTTRGASSGPWSGSGSWNHKAKLGRRPRWLNAVCTAKYRSLTVS